MFWQVIPGPRCIGAEGPVSKEGLGSGDKKVSVDGPQQPCGVYSMIISHRYFGASGSLSILYTCVMTLNTMGQRPGSQYRLLITGEICSLLLYRVRRRALLFCSHCGCWTLDVDDTTRSVLVRYNPEVINAWVTFTAVSLSKWHWIVVIFCTW